MAREQLGVAPTRPDDTVTIAALQAALAQIQVQQGQTRIVGEVPAGNIDGTNVAFTTAFNFTAGSTEVYLNGLREHLGEGYVEVGDNEILLSDAPQSTDDLVVCYVRSN